MKFYTYKNGEIAFFENNEKMLISKEEKEALVIDDFTTTVLAYCIEKKVEKSKYMIVPFSKILDEYRKGNFTVEKKTINEWNIQIVRENGEVVALASSDGEGHNNICMNYDSWFEDAKKELGVE